MVRFPFRFFIFLIIHLVTSNELDLNDAIIDETIGREV